MDTKRICSICGRPLAASAPEGLCPECLLKAGLGTGADLSADSGSNSKTSAFNPPTIAELAPLFPQLEILDLIGKGGMGAVYRARQKELERIVALKILPPDIGKDAAFAERFAREAKALAKLNHPGIVTIHDFGRANGLYFFVMEFVDGVNLRQLLHTGRISAREALAIVPQICDALQFAHDQGVVHRDIKPENILLDRRGSVKVADFGLAKLIGTGNEPVTDAGGAAGGSGLTASGKIMGTVSYMAPEQVEHPNAVDHRADIYALGVVFYQMLTGELPGGKIEPPSRKVQIDVRLDEVVLRALEEKPELRYQQVSALKTQVETIAATAVGGGRKEAGAEKPEGGNVQSKTPGSRNAESSRYTLPEHFKPWMLAGSCIVSLLLLPAAISNLTGMGALALQWAQVWLGVGIVVVVIYVLAVLVILARAWLNYLLPLAGITGNNGLDRALRVSLKCLFWVVAVRLAGPLLGAFGSLLVVFSRLLPGDPGSQIIIAAALLFGIALTAGKFWRSHRESLLPPGRNQASAKPQTAAVLEPWLAFCLSAGYFGVTIFFVLNMLFTGHEPFHRALPGVFSGCVLCAAALAVVLSFFRDSHARRKAFMAMSVMAFAAALPVIALAGFFAYELALRGFGWIANDNEGAIILVTVFGACALPVFRLRLRRAAQFLSPANRQPLPHSPGNPSGPASQSKGF